MKLFFKIQISKIGIWDFKIILFNNKFPFLKSTFHIDRIVDASIEFLVALELSLTRWMDGAWIDDVVAIGIDRWWSVGYRHNTFNGLRFIGEFMGIN